MSLLGNQNILHSYCGWGGCGPPGSHLLYLVGGQGMFHLQELMNTTLVIRYSMDLLVGFHHLFSAPQSWKISCLCWCQCWPLVIGIAPLHFSLWFDCENLPVAIFDTSPVTLFSWWNCKGVKHSLGRILFGACMPQLQVICSTLPPQ